jgi:hypothetical protein
MSANAAADELQQRRRRTGFVTIACGLIAAVGFVFASPDDVWPAAAMRIGIVFGALWLCFPSGKRRAAWAVLTPTRMFLLAVLAWYGTRIKFLIPAILVLFVVLRFLRPRNRR